MKLLVVALVVAGSVAHASPQHVQGTVIATRSTWSGDAIVTESDVRDAGGHATTVVQLGGAVDGIGMTFSHQPALLRAGDAVSLVADERVTARGTRALAITAVARVAPAASAARITSAAAPPGSASYGVQRTTISGRPLYRESGCIHVAYDASTVTPATAKALDASFAAWTTATQSCGGLEISTSYEPNVPTASDGLTSVHVRSQTWCRPATATVPELCYSPDVVAVTRLTFVDSAFDPVDGKILEADMEINEVDYQLLLPGEPVPTSSTRPLMYFRAVTTHEVGHLIGLAHDCGTGTEEWPTDANGVAVAPCNQAPAEILASTMFYAVEELDDGPSSLEPNDVAGACELVAQLSCTAETTAGCAASTPSNAWPLVALGGLAVLGRRRRTRREVVA